MGIYFLLSFSFTEKGIKKLMESFNTYEHALSEDFVMDNFRNIINKIKKFAKPEVRVCIDEFEEKFNKFHTEKKEQEVTTGNAQIHQQKVDTMGSLVVDRNAGEGSAESDISEDGEPIDPSEKGMTQSTSTSESDESDEHSGASSEVAETETDDNEVQSPRVNMKGTKSRAKKSNLKDEKETISASNRRNLRSKQRWYFF